MRFHERIADGGDTIEDTFGDGRGGSGEGSYKVNVGVGALGALVQALEAERHCGGVRMQADLVVVGFGTGTDFSLSYDVRISLTLLGEE